LASPFHGVQWRRKVLELYGPTGRHPRLGAYGLLANFLTNSRPRRPYKGDDPVAAMPMTNHGGGGPTRDERFHDFYQERFLDVSGFVRRRVAASDASDVIAQVFTVAWRRFDVIPAPPEDRLWLFGVARRTVASHRRSGLRRFQLYQRLFEQLVPPSSPSDDDHLLARVEIAIARLRPNDREVLRLILWDDLTHAEAATILGCTPNAVDLRFRRAQKRVRAALGITTAPIDAPAVPVCKWRTQP